MTFGAGTQSVTGDIADLDGSAGNTTGNGLGGTGGGTALADTGGGMLTLAAREDLAAYPGLR